MYSGHIALLSKICSGLTVNKLFSGWELILLNSGRNKKKNIIRAGVLLKVNINVPCSVFHDKLNALLEKILSHKKEPNATSKINSDNRDSSIYP